MKKELSSYVDELGITDEKGHHFLKTENYLLKRERRVSRSLNGDAVRAWAEDLGIWQDLITTETVEYLDEDKLLALGYSKPELQEQISGFYEEKVTWAFKMT